MKQVTITITETLSKSFKIDLEEGQDVRQAFLEQHWEIVGLLEVLRGFLTSELCHRADSKYRLPHVLELLDSCKDWKSDNIIISNGQNCKNTESANDGTS